MTIANLNREVNLFILEMEPVAEKLISDNTTLRIAVAALESQHRQLNLVRQSEIELLRTRNALLSEEVATLQAEFDCVKEDDFSASLRQIEEAIASVKTILKRDCYRNINSHGAYTTARQGESLLEQIKRLSNEINAVLKKLDSTTCKNWDGYSNARSYGESHWGVSLYKDAEKTLHARAKKTFEKLLLWEIEQFPDRKAQVTSEIQRLKMENPVFQ